MSLRIFYVAGACVLCFGWFLFFFFYCFFGWLAGSFCLDCWINLVSWLLSLLGLWVDNSFWVILDGWVVLIGKGLLCCDIVWVLCFVFCFLQVR